MRIFMDEEPCQIAGNSVAEVIASGAAFAESRGRMVVEVIVDGRRWKEEEIATAQDSQAEADEIRFETVEPAGLVSQVCEDASAVLDDADVIQREAADLVEAGRQPEAMTKLNEALAIWHNVQQALTMSAEIMHWDLDAESDGPASPRAVIDRLNSQLKLIRDALQTDDPIGLSDLLRYELPEVVQQWRGLLQRLKDRAMQGDSGQ